MNQPLAQAIDPETAIWNKDLAELSRAVEAGWALPYARVKDGLVPDTTLVIRIISLRWTEGWLLISKNRPELKTNPLLWQLAIRRGVHEIVADMLANGMEASGRLENGTLPLHVLAESFSQPGEPVDESDMVKTAQVLVAAGADPLEAYPGVVTPGGASPKGHTLWTRSIYYRCWEICHAFMPTSWEQLMGMPRGLEAIEDLRHAAQAGDKGALRIWKQWTQKFLKPWLESAPAETFVSPIDMEAITALPPEQQNLVWKRWERVDEIGWTPLHDLALQGGEERAHRVLKIMVETQASCLALWTKPDNDGMRPCDLWEIANGRDPEDSKVNAGQVLEVKSLS